MYQNKDFKNFEQNFNELRNQLFRVKNFAVSLLEYTMLEIDDLQLKKEKIKISNLILNCIEDERLRAKERGIKISYELLNELNLYGNKLYMSQIFKNLISNAINYTPKSNHGKIIIRTEQSKDMIRISVKDNGIGLTKEDMQELFKWESNIKSNNKNIIKGTGIGLFITKHIVESLKGKIWVESDGINKGSNFILEFPTKLL